MGKPYAMITMGCVRYKGESVSVELFRLDVGDQLRLVVVPGDMDPCVLLDVLCFHIVMICLKVKDVTYAPALAIDHITDAS